LPKDITLGAGRSLLRCGIYGADGRRTGSAATSGNMTMFYGADGRRTGSSTVTGKR